MRFLSSRNANVGYENYLGNYTNMNKLRNYLVLTLASFLLSGAALVTSWYRVSSTLPTGAPTSFEEVSYGDTGVKEGWVRLTQVRGNHTNASTTNQFQIQNLDGRTRIIDRIIVMRTGTSSNTFILDMATTTSRTDKTGTVTQLYNYGVSFARATNTPLIAIGSVQWSTTTSNILVFDSLMQGSLGTTTANQQGGTYTQPVFDVKTAMSPTTNNSNVTRGAFEWKPNEYLSAAINLENYANNCGAGASLGAAGCTAHATATVGFIVDIFAHYVATTTYSTP